MPDTPTTTPEVLAELEARLNARDPHERWYAPGPLQGSGSKRAVKASTTGAYDDNGPLIGLMMTEEIAQLIAALRNDADALLTAAEREIEMRELLSALAANLAIYAHAWRTDNRVPTFASDISEGLLAKAQALLRAPEEPR